MRAASAAEKLVALAYADRHNEETGCAYPSLAWLCEFSSLNRKTVIAAVMRLEAAGFLTDTGERRGETRQIKVYRLHLETVPKSEPSQKRNSTEKVAKQSQKRDTDTVRTSSSKKASPSQKSARAPKATPFRMPEDWKPTRFADGTVAREVIDRRGIEWGRAALESFRSWAANADDTDGVGRKLNWQAAWIKWVIEQDKRDGRQSATQRVAGNHQGYGRAKVVSAALAFIADGQPH